MTRSRWFDSPATLILALFLTAGAWAGPNAGDAPPNEVGKNFEGDPVVLADYKGKAIVVSFWATWCPYCLKELPILEGIQNSAGKANLQVIAVNTESSDVFRRAAKTLRSLQLLVAHDASKQASRRYGVEGIPHMVIVGRSGQIVKVYRGYDETSLEKIVVDINKALAEQPAT